MKLEYHHFHLFIILLVKRIEKPQPRFNEWKNVSFSLGKTTKSYGKRNGERDIGEKDYVNCSIFMSLISCIGMKDTMLCPKSSLLSPLEYAVIIEEAPGFTKKA